MPYESSHPPIRCPADVTVWSRLFESPVFTKAETKGITNAATGERITYRELKQHAEHLSTALVRRHGLRASDTVVLLSPNTVWYPVAMHATLRAGGKVAGASPSYGVEEMAYLLRISEAKFIMTVPDSLAVATAAASSVGIHQNQIFLLEGSKSGFANLKDLILLGEMVTNASSLLEPYRIPPGKTNHDICGYLSFSSGTTGKPKAVMISHQNVIAQCLQMGAITSPDVDKVFAVLPLYHITGLVHMLHLPILLGAEVVMLPKFTMTAMLDAIVRYQLRELILVPPLLIRLVRDPIIARYDLSCIRRFSSGSAPLPREVIQLLQKKFPQTGFKQGYGMTESTSCLTAHSPEHYEWSNADTVGTIVPSTQIKIVDERNNEVDEGEILAKGPQCAMGYLGNAQATKEAFDPDGWLRTGDKGKIDSNGLVRITGRLKDIIKVKGIAISPAELEDVLMAHPKVLDAAVVGVPDSYSGERPKAYVVVGPGVAEGNDVKEELLGLVREKKDRNKWLAGLEFIDAVPKAPSGKILRRELRDRALLVTRVAKL